MLDLNSLEAIIATRIKAKMSKKIKEKYKNLQITTQEESKTPVQFPNVYVFLMESPEIGMTLEGTSFAGGLFTFTIKVTDNQNQTRVKEVMGEVVRIMKSMRFQMPFLPIYQNTKDEYWSNARFRRTICDGDIL